MKCMLQLPTHSPQHNLILHQTSKIYLIHVTYSIPVPTSTIHPDISLVANSAKRTHNSVPEIAAPFAITESSHFSISYFFALLHYISIDLPVQPDALLQCAQPVHEGEARLHGVHGSLGQVVCLHYEGRKVGCSPLGHKLLGPHQLPILRHDHIQQLCLCDWRAGRGCAPLCDLNHTQ